MLLKFVVKNCMLLEMIGGSRLVSSRTNNLTYERNVRTYSLRETQLGKTSKLSDLTGHHV